MAALAVICGVLPSLSNTLNPMRLTKNPWVLCSALAASMLANLYLLRERPSVARRGLTPPVALTASGEPAPVPPSATTSPALQGVCEAELERCLQSGWNAVLKEITQPPPVRKDSKQVVDRDRATPARQREALCEVAEAHLQNHWQSNKDTITRVIAATLADQQAEAREVRETVEKMTRTLRLTPDEGDALASEYGRLRADRINRIRSALGRNPVDYPAFLDEAKGLFADEDALIERVEGSEAKERWRLAMLTERTPRLAILATFAGSGWDTATQW